MHVANPVLRIREPLRAGITEQFFDLGADEPPFGFQAELGYVSHRRQLLYQVLVKSFGFIARPFVRRAFADIDGNSDGSRRSSVRSSNRRPVGLECQPNVR